MYWGMGKIMMKAGRFVERHPQLFGTYITNFSCGPDSFVVGYFREIMGRKPSLTLELDSHTADAGLEKSWEEEKLPMDDGRLDECKGWLRDAIAAWDQDGEIKSIEWQIKQDLPDGSGFIGYADQSHSAHAASES